MEENTENIEKTNTITPLDNLGNPATSEKKKTMITLPIQFPRVIPLKKSLLKIGNQ